MRGGSTIHHGFRLGFVLHFQFQLLGCGGGLVCTHASTVAREEVCMPDEDGGNNNFYRATGIRGSGADGIATGT